MGAALELLISCCCSGDAGCPNCVQVGLSIYVYTFVQIQIYSALISSSVIVQNLACQEYNEVLHKDAAVMIIKVVSHVIKQVWNSMMLPCFECILTVRGLY